MTNLVYDNGNFEWKFLVSETGQSGALMNAVAPLSERQWNEIVGRGKPPPGLIRVNGQSFAIGAAARRHTIPERPKGASRYVMNYYGAALAYTMTQAFPDGDKQITLAASHPPGDARYSGLIEELACRDWVVEFSEGRRRYSVVDFMPFDEPMGGYANLSLNKDGSENRRYRHRNQIVLVIDIGGHTIDWVPIDPGGQIDYVAADSSKGSGTLRVMKQFESDLHSLYLKELVETENLDPRKIEDAMRTGEFQFGRKTLPCQPLATAAVNTLINDIRAVINQAGGVANYDVFVLTGGGAALVYEAIQVDMPDVHFVLAAGISEMRLANVLGGAKLLNMYLAG